MIIETFPIDGVLVFRPERLQDDCGGFSQNWSQDAAAQAGLKLRFIQDNISLSRHTGTLRGLHCQVPPMAQGKLIQVVSGEVLDVAVDIRQGSATYGQHVSRVLCEEDPAQMWIPPGFLHGFVTRRSDTRVLYRTTAPYSRDHERAVIWNDPDLAIDWGVDQPVLSPRDGVAARLRDLGVLFGADGSG